MGMCQLNFFSQENFASQWQCQEIGGNYSIEAKTEKWNIVNLYAWIQPAHTYDIAILMSYDDDMILSNQQFQVQQFFYILPINTYVLLHLLGLGKKNLRLSIYSYILNMIKSANRLTFLLNQISYSTSSAKKETNIDVQYYDGFAKVVINKPKALNSLNLDMVVDLQSHLQRLNTQTKAFWMEGAGGKAFCAGGDVKALSQSKTKNPPYYLDFLRTQFRTDYKISRLNSVQIANWDGIIMGGGVGVSGNSPFRIATQNTLLAMPQNKIGFFPDVGSSYIFSRLRNQIGFYLSLTGARLKGEQVFIAGLANYYILRQNIPKVYNEIKQNIPKSTNPRATIEKILNSYHKAPTTTTLQNEEHIKHLFDSKSIHEIFSKLEKNKNIPFYAETKKLLESQCPISVQITFRDLVEAKSKSLKQVFLTHFRLANRVQTGTDFYEGVRCALVDKNDKPKWSHNHIFDVPESEVDKYFAPLLPEDELKL